MTAAQITAAVAVVAAALIVPIPVAGWAAAAVICALWPNPDKPETLQRQMTETQSLRARKAIVLGKQLRSPTAATVGFGDPGNDPYNPEPVPWPPSRLSAWWSLYGAVAAAVVAWFLPVPWFCPPPARAVLTGLGAFLLFQSFAAGARAGKDNIETAPAALWDTPSVTQILKDHIAGIVAAAAVGAVGAVLLFGPTITWFTKGVTDTAGTVGGIVTPATTTIPGATTPPTPTSPAVDTSPTPAPHNEGTQLPATLIAALTALSALTAAAAVFTRIYTQDQLTEWTDYITKRDEWQQRWETMNLAPPIYVTTVPLPHGTEEPTHELVAFTTHSGFTWEDYAKYHEGVQTALGKPFVLFRPMPQRDETGRNIPGTANPGEFTITYPTGLFPPDAHLDPDTDHQTRRFLTEHRFQHAFAAAKAGTPIFIAQRPLHRSRSQGVLYETIWKLPKEIDVATVATKHLLLAQNLGCKWLRVGTHTTDVHGRQLPTQEITIIYGDHPDTVDLRDPTLKHWLETLTWDAWWRDCKITNNDNYAPRLTHTEQNDRGFTEADFALPPGIEIETCRKAIPALCATSGYGYIEIEPDETGNPSLIHLVAGLKDPLNEQYLFIDYADQILHEPAAGQPQLDWAVGVGADGELMWYSFENELPHMLLAGSSGQGKATTTNTLLVTANGGFVRMGDITVGEHLLDETGGLCTVTRVYDIHFPRRCFVLTFDDGTEVTVSGDHKWRTHSAAYRAALSRIKRREVRDRSGEAARLAEALAADPDLGWGHHPVDLDAGEVFDADRVAVAPVEEFERGSGVEFDSVPPLDPFLVGVWLGAPKAGSLSVRTSRQELPGLLAGLGYSIGRCDAVGTRVEFSVRGVSHRFSAAGLLKERRVPSWLLLAGEPVRMLAAAGLAAVADLTAGDGGAGRRLRMSDAGLADDVVKLLTGVGCLVDVSVKGRWTTVEFDVSGVGLPEPEPLPAAGLLPVHPFVLGVWLAAGSAGSAMLSLDESLAGRLVECGCVVAPATDNEDRVTPRWWVRGIVSGLRDLGVYDTPTIPDMYLSDQGVAAGLVEGLVVPGDRQVFTTTDRLLAAQAAKAVAVASGMRPDPVLVNRRGGDAIWEVDCRAVVGDGNVTNDEDPLLYDRFGRRLATVKTITVDAGISPNVVYRVIRQEGLVPVEWRRVMTQRYEGRLVRKPCDVNLYPRNVIIGVLCDEANTEPVRTGYGPRVVTTQDIYDTLYTTGARHAANHAIPLVTQPLQYDPLPAPLPIDPYTLGAWLGDGSAWHGQICGVDHQVFEQVAHNTGYPCRDLQVPTGSHPDFRLVAFGTPFQDGLKSDLQKEGLLRNKHIPDVYLRASVTDRLALLQGLMDTDGHAATDGTCQLRMSNEQLVTQAKQLVESLGIKCSPVRRREPRQETHSPSWQITFTTSLPMFTLPRKLARQPIETRVTQQYRYVVACREVPVVPCRCIEVDSPSHEYLVTRSFVPTHNSVLESSMLTQLLHNNDPHDLELRCVEPKNELQAIQSFEHVSRFVDFNTLTPGQSFYAGTADMLDDTVAEMERRYQLMTNHPEQPRKLSEARLIASREAPPPGMDRHPFDLPYIVVVIEECGDIFRVPTLRSEKQDHERVLYAAELLARKARAAGIYLIMVTQYPTNQNIPSTIKQQTRRIGLAVNTQIASMVIIDEPGLEAIQVKGRGLMSYGKGYRGFRALYLRRPSEEDPDLPDDFVSFTTHIPRHGGLITVGGNPTGTLRRPPQPPPGIW